MKHLSSLFLCAVLLLSLLSVCASAADIPVAEYAPNPYLTVINKQSRLPDDWNSRFEFSVGQNSLGELHIVESGALESFEKLRDYLLKTQGVQIELDSVYRSLDQQQEIWDYWLEEYGTDYCEQYLAPVGCSEHHTGLALDIFLVKDGEIIRDNDAMLAETDTFATIHAALADFNFILRYLPGKEDITGYSYEPWHLRYIGDATIASDIMFRNLTLEEYMAEIPA